MTDGEMKEVIQMTGLQCGMVDKGSHIENLGMAPGTIWYGKGWMIQGTIEIEETGIHQGTVRDHTLMITFQMAMLQVPDKEILLKVIQGFGRGMMVINLILETESQDVMVTCHIHPIMDNRK